jgi:tetratricopeptide (TPR) repeat protein
VNSLTSDSIKARLGLSGPPLNRIPGPAPRIPDHEMLRCIGQGSYGEVWLARSAVGTWRAVKVVYRQNFKDPRPYEREFAGIQSYEPVSRTNEGLIDVLQIGRSDAEGYFYYVMELADSAADLTVAEPGAEPSKSEQDVRSFVEAPAKFDPDAYIPKTLSRVILQRGRLSYEECLTLGLTLNLALGHLHRHGLIHRDVKPSNIVFINGVPKLTDIGLVTDVAGAESFVGTEGFIPPEGPNSSQADLYALGKVLYEASMGKDRNQFPEPLTQLGLDADSRSLMELNAVLVRACAPDPKERYHRAEEMNADLALLHNGESVRDKHVLARRVRLLTRVALVIVAVLILAVVPYSFAIREAGMARASAIRANVEASKSAAVAQFLKEMLTAARPSVAMARDTTLLRELLNNTVQRLDAQTNPEVESEVREVLGQVYFELGEYTDSERMLRLAVQLHGDVPKEQARSLAACLSELSLAISAQGRPDEAESLQRKALAMRLGLGTSNELDVAESYQALGTILSGANRASEAEVMYKNALDIRERELKHKQDWRVAESMKGLASILGAQGQWAAAERLYRETMEIERGLAGERHVAYLWTLNGLVQSLLTQKKFEEAEATANRVLSLAPGVLSPDHPLIASTLTRLARVLTDQNKSEPAKEHLDRALKIWTKRLNNQDPGMGDTVSALFDILFTEHKYLEARQVFDRVAKASAMSKPNKTLVSICGNYLARTGQWEEATNYYRTLIQLDPGNHQAYQALASLYVQLDDSAAFGLIREEMLAKFGSVTNDPRIADRIAKSCLMIPPQGEMLTKAAALANISVTYDGRSLVHPWFQFCKGFAELRSSHYAEAKQWMAKVAEHENEGSVRDVEAHIVVALAEHGLGHEQAALQAYADGVELSTHRMRDVSSGDIENGWTDWILSHALMREAKQAISIGTNNNASPAPP